MGKKKSILWFMAAYAVYQAATSFAHPVLPTLIKERQMHDYMFGVAMASMMTANFLFSPFWGKLCNYVSTKYIMVYGCFGYIVAQLIFCFAKTELDVIIARFLAGIFLGAIVTAAVNYIINISDDEKRPRNLIVTATIQNVASAAGFFIGGMLGEISIKVTFFTQCACIVLSSILYALTCNKDDGEKQKMPEAPVFIKQANPFAVMLEAKKFMTASFAILFTVIALGSFGGSAFDQCFNYFLKDQFGLTSSYNGIFKAASAAVGLTVNSTLNFMLIRRTDIRKTVIFLLGTGSALVSSVLFFDSLALAVAMNITFFGVNAMRVPMQQNIVAKKAQGKDSNVIMAFHHAMGSLGGMFGSLLAGLVYTKWVKFPFLIGTVSFVAAAILAFIYYKYDKRENAQA